MIFLISLKYVNGTHMVNEWVKVLKYVNGTHMVNEWVKVIYICTYTGCPSMWMKAGSKKARVFPVPVYNKTISYLS